MNDLKFTTANLRGLHFKRQGKGGGYAAPLPFTPEEGAEKESWDAETMTLTYQVKQPDIDGIPQDSIEMEAVITEADIESGKVYVTTPKPPSVPTQVSKAQLKLALLEIGIDINELINQLPEDKQAAARILVDDADYFSRDANMVQILGALAGLDSDDLDSLFIAANSINPEEI